MRQRSDAPAGRLMRGRAAADNRCTNASSSCPGDRPPRRRPARRRPPPCRRGAPATYPNAERLHAGPDPGHAADGDRLRRARRPGSRGVRRVVGPGERRRVVGSPAWWRSSDRRTPEHRVVHRRAHVSPGEDRRHRRARPGLGLRSGIDRRAHARDSRRDRLRGRRRPADGDLRRRRRARRGSAIAGATPIRDRLCRRRATPARRCGRRLGAGIPGRPARGGDGAASGARPGRDRGEGEERVPRQHEPRDPHPDERRHRHDRPAARHVAQPRAARVRRDDPRQRAMRCSSIINDILDFSKIESGHAGARAAAPSTSGPASRRRSTCSRPRRPSKGARARLLRAPTASRRWSSATSPGSARCWSTCSATRSSSPTTARSSSRVPPRPLDRRADTSCTSRSATPASASRRTAWTACSSSFIAGRRLDDPPVRRHRPRSRDQHAVSPS